jgi:hypothetical protein
MLPVLSIWREAKAPAALQQASWKMWPTVQKVGSAATSSLDLPWHPWQGWHGCGADHDCSV